MSDLIRDYVNRVEKSEKQEIPRKVSKSNLQWQPKHYPVGKFDFDVTKERLQKLIESGDKVKIKTMKTNIKRLVRDNPHYNDFAQLLDM